MFFVLSKLFDVLLSPLVWGLALIALALPWRVKRARNAGKDRALGASGIALILFFSMAPVANRLFAYLESSATDSTRPDVTYDTVVLLGGLVEDDATIAHGTTAYSDSVERLLVTFDMLRDNRARTAIISAGPSHVGGQAIEADRLKNQLVDWGIAPERIFTETRAMNTQQNAVFVTEIVKEQGFSSVVIVTSAFHMSRAAGCFRQVGLSFDTLPADYRAYDPDRTNGSLIPRTAYLDASARAIHEIAGRAVYRIIGYSKSAN